MIGQIDFTNNQVNFVDAIGMNAPVGVAIDKANGHVIVADSQNNRVHGMEERVGVRGGRRGGPGDRAAGF